MTRLQLAKQLIEEKTGKDGKCTVSKNKLAAILHLKYPSVFKDKEDARRDVRTVTGAGGELKRKQAKTRIEWKGLSLPEPEKNDYSKFLIRESRIGILSDIHFPYYDKEALNAAIDYLRKWGPDCILLNGDILDMYALSRFEKDPRARSFSYELDMLRSFVQQLRKIFPNARIVHKLGNHCERYEKLILQRVPELVDLELFKIENVISAKELGIEVVQNKRLIKAGKLNICHGHEFTSGFVAPVNPARGFYMRAKSNILGSHHHRISTHHEPDINGNVIAAWSTGCLCELHPKYMPNNLWEHGFATVENFGTDFSVQNLAIIKGKVM